MGRWTEIWDEDRQKWVQCYIELPVPLTKGTATAGSPDVPPTIFGPDSKPLTRPRRPSIGFRKGSDF